MLSGAFDIKNQCKDIKSLCVSRMFVLKEFVLNKVPLYQKNLMVI